VALAAGIAGAVVMSYWCCFFFQAEDGIRDKLVTGVQTCALPIFKRPITYVIPNNQGYKILKQRLMSFRGTDKYIGMNITDPAIDYVKLSESMGVPAMRIENPSDLNDALTRATRSNRANLIEVMVSTDIHS